MNPEFSILHATEQGMLTPDYGTGQPVILHGYKDSTAMDIARRLMLECVK